MADGTTLNMITPVSQKSNPLILNTNTTVIDEDENENNTSSMVMVAQRQRGRSGEEPSGDSTPREFEQAPSSDK